MLKTLGFPLGFQHFPRDLADVNEWKIVFDPSIVAELWFYIKVNTLLSCPDITVPLNLWNLLPN